MHWGAQFVPLKTSLCIKRPQRDYRSCRESTETQIQSEAERLQTTEAAEGLQAYSCSVHKMTDLVTPAQSACGAMVTTVQVDKYINRVSRDTTARLQRLQRDSRDTVTVRSRKTIDYRGFGETTDVQL